jgi:hypothetical protein
MHAMAGTDSHEVVDPVADPAIDAVIAEFELRQRGEDTAYLVSADLRLVHTNLGWIRFALANDGEEMVPRWGLGTSVIDAIPSGLRELYRTRFEGVLASGADWVLDYECSSAEHYRQFRMTASRIDHAHLMVSHAVLELRDHSRVSHPPDDALYRRDGLIDMCAYCRRVSAKTLETPRWDWVADYVANPPPNLTHGICPLCVDHYFP